MIDNKVYPLSFERFFDGWTVGFATPSEIEVIDNEANKKVERKS